MRGLFYRGPSLEDLHTGAAVRLEIDERAAALALAVLLAPAWHVRRIRAN
ncbi:hypothetical protein [Blastococcus deserti]|uniref:Uncharacterized protein n=1 Tax=Blastococcus deserti TaxID=2259033 RepID=A0ABW4X4S5_9ACTN